MSAAPLLRAEQLSSLLGNVREISSLSVARPGMRPDPQQEWPDRRPAVG